jgi:hypothetical protein
MMVVTNIDRYAIQPRLRISLDPVQILQQSQKNFLRGVLRVFQTPQEAISRPHDSLLMQSDKIVKAAPVHRRFRGQTDFSRGCLRCYWHCNFHVEIRAWRPIVEDYLAG